MRVVYFGPALDDIEAITDYIARDSLIAAARVERRLRETVALLANQPDMGRPGRIGRTRELIVPPYIVVYHVRSQVVEVLAVIDGRRGAIATLIIDRLDDVGIG